MQYMINDKVNEIIKHLTNKYNKNIAIAMHNGPDGENVSL